LERNAKVKAREVEGRKTQGEAVEEGCGQCGIMRGWAEKRPEAIWKRLHFLFDLPYGLHEE
jgi:hypothetical protein